MQNTLKKYIFFRDGKDWNLEDVSEQRDCEFCSGSYKSKKILLEHVRGIHKVKYACKHCDITLNNHKTYEKHLKGKSSKINHLDCFNHINLICI